MYKQKTLRALILILGLSIFSYLASSKNEMHFQKTEPRYEVAILFINNYVDHCNDPTSEIGIIKWVNNRQDVTNDFKTELNRIISEAEKKDQELGLGFDPILDAQDYPVAFEIEKKDSVFLVVKGIDWPEFRLTLKLKLEGKKWLVDGSGIINIPENKRIERW